MRTTLLGVATLLVATMPLPGYTENFPAAQIKAFQNLEDGMWQHTFTTVPANAAIPKREEKACVSVQKQLLQAMAQSEGSVCTFKITKNESTSAEVLGSCTLMPKTPPMQVNYSITRSGPNAIELQAVTTVPTVNTKMTFVHKASRLGACGK